MALLTLITYGALSILSGTVQDVGLVTNSTTLTDFGSGTITIGSSSASATLSTATNGGNNAPTVSNNITINGASTTPTPFS